MENLFTENCIRTYSGIYFNVFDPKPEMVNINDIAHALSMQPRFGGHLPEFYSVAQHSIHVCDKLSDGNEIYGLLHDASEAYLIDMPRPVKKGLTNYKEIEEKIMKVISDAFGLVYNKFLFQSLKNADNEMLQIEWDSLMIGKNNTLNCLNQFEAKLYFLNRYDFLTGNDKIQSEPAAAPAINVEKKEGKEVCQHDWDNTKAGNYCKVCDKYFDDE